MEHLSEQSGSWKARLRELIESRRALFPSRAWRPWINQTSECSLTVNPFPQDVADLNLGPQVSVPVGLGASRGQSLVVGISIRTEELLEDNVCVGIEAGDSKRAMSIYFAPMSGHCFIQHCEHGRHNGPTMRCAALPALDAVPEILHVWIQLTEKGAIRFLRKAEGHEPEDEHWIPDADKIQDAGTMSPEMFPHWIKEYYACLHFWGKALQAAASVSIDHAADSFPSWFVDKSVTEMDASWRLLNAEDW
jgi:hypothetical protein